MNLHAVEDAIANRLAVMSNPSNLCHCHPVLCGALGKEIGLRFGKTCYCPP